MDSGAVSRDVIQGEYRNGTMVTPMAEGGFTISTAPDATYRPHVEHLNRKERRKQKALERKAA